MSLIDFILRRKPIKHPWTWAPKHDIDFSKGTHWGFNYEVMSNDNKGNYNIAMWIPYPIEVDDAITMECESGKRGMFIVKKIERMEGVSDGYFVDIRGVIRYKEEGEE